MKAQPAAFSSTRKGKPALRSALPRVVFLCALLAMLVGCNDDTTTVTAPVATVDATLSARVLSYPSGAPLEGTYRLIGTSTTGTTATDGSFTIEHLTSGTYRLEVDAPGHASTQYGVLVDATGAPDGRVHLHEDIYLIEKTGSLRVSLFTGADGQPARRAVADLQSWSYGNNIFRHELVDATVPAMVQADSAGVITLTDLPATGFTLVVRPYDVDGDGFFECCSSANALTLTPGSTTLANITLPVEVGTPAVTYSNVDGLGGTPLREPALIVVYSAPMDTSAARTSLILTRQGFPNVPLPMTWRWTSPVRLEVRSASPLNDESAYYNVWISAVSTRGARIQWVSDFYWLTPGGPQDGCDEEVTGFVLTPGHRIDYDSRTLYLDWDALACARGYEIYARDDRDNPRWIHVGSSTNDFEDGTVSTAFQLPVSFDRYLSDVTKTPFAGISVTLCIVPARAQNPNPGGTHPTLVLADMVPPTVQSAGTGFTYPTDGVSPDQLFLSTTLTEYAGASQGAPVVLVAEGGGDPNYHLDPAQMTWTWSQGKQVGLAVLYLDPAEDASGDSIGVSFATLSDLSGNDTTGVVSHMMEIPAYDRRFTFEGSGQGWSRLGDGWASGAPQTGPGAAYRGTGCWGTNMTGEYGDAWNTTLTSPEIAVPNTLAPSLRFQSWFDTNSPNDTWWVEVLHGGNVDVLMPGMWGQTNGWVEYSVSLQPYAGQRIQIRFTFQSDGADGGAGVFLDDVSVRGN